MLGSDGCLSGALPGAVGSVRDITQAERNYAVAMPEQVRLLNRLFHHSSSVYACSDRLVFCLAKYNLLLDKKNLTNFMRCCLMTLWG